MRRAGSDEQGWALLGLLLALGVMSIVLVSAIVPNIQAQVQREKEVEMMYRGEQMALGIARYYNRGRIGPIRIDTGPPNPLPYLTDLKKLRDGRNLVACYQERDGSRSARHCCLRLNPDELNGRRRRRRWWRLRWLHIISEDVSARTWVIGAALSP